MKNLLLLVFYCCVFLFSFAPKSALAQPDCSGQVTLGDVMAGLHAGFTGGAVEIRLPDGVETNTLPSGLFLTSMGSPVRGFIDVENSGAFKCVGDFGLVNVWISCDPLGGDKGGKSRKCVDRLFLDVTIAVDGEEIPSIRTKAKIGFLPMLGNPKYAIANVGGLLEPYSLGLGLHKASAFVEVDFDCIPPPDFAFDASLCDGIADVSEEILTYFEVIAEE